MYRHIPDHLSGDIATTRAARDNERPPRLTWRTKYTPPEREGCADWEVPGEAIPMPEAANG
jgi:hypothetical protein